MELLASIEGDPWGLSYRLVTKKLTMGTNLTESLKSEVLKDLFPEHEFASLLVIDVVWSEDWNVTHSEVIEAIKEKCSLNTAPGCDSIRPLLFRLIPGSMVAKMAAVFLRSVSVGVCFRITGRLPSLF